MTSPILFAGGEDISFNYSGGQLQAPQENYAFYPWSGTGGIRPGYARYGISVSDGGNNQGATNSKNTLYMRSAYAFNATSFWTTARFWNNQGNAGVASFAFMRWADINGMVRLQLSVNDALLPATINIQTVDASSVVTTLVTSGLSFGSLGPALPDKVDVFINYGTSGSISVYCNGALIATYSGNITTNSVTSLSYLDLGCANGNGVNPTVNAWSEVVVSTNDTRNMSVVTQWPISIGNSNTWTSTNVSSIGSNLTIEGTTSFSSNINQLDLFQMTPTMPGGSFAVVSVVQQAWATSTIVAPSNVQLSIQTGNILSFSSNIQVSPAWGVVVNNWDLNPATGSSWQISNLVASSNNFEIGFKSIT